MSIYFDNSATTKIDKEVLSVICDYSENKFANPSAMHRLGFLCEEDVKKANSDIAKILCADENEIIWTSGGTESNNLAIKGYVYANKKNGNHLITTKIEHPSVLNVFKLLEDEGFNVTYLDVNSSGHIDLGELKNSITDKTLLVSIMHMNNEIGSVQNLDEIGNIIKTVNKKTVFHVDAVQGFGKYKYNVKKENIDFLSVSSHKFHGPKGCGFLYKNKNIRIIPLNLGGGQQNDLRSGTLNVPSIIGTSKAANIAYDSFDSYTNHLRNLRNLTIIKLSQLNEKYGIIRVNTLMNDLFAPHIVSVSFLGIRAEVMLHSLEEKEIYVSAGSACSSHNKKISNTLKSIGLENKQLESTIRISFGRYNTESEVEEFIRALDDIIPRLLI